MLNDRKWLETIVGLLSDRLRKSKSSNEVDVNSVTRNFKYQFSHGAVYEGDWVEAKVISEMYSLIISLDAWTW